MTSNDITEADRTHQRPVTASYGEQIAPFEALAESQPPTGYFPAYRG
jgi:hypothetical protein